MSLKVTCGGCKATEEFAVDLTDPRKTERRLLPVAIRDARRHLRKCDGCVEIELNGHVVFSALREGSL